MLSFSCGAPSPPFPHTPLPNRTPRHAGERRCRPQAVGQRMVDAYASGPLHPVLDILKRRLETGSMPGRRRDGRKVALCIEGGGMRGAVSAGMAAAIKYCGLENTFDVVYGSSAGSIVGAYFVSRQLPVYGAQIYYDIICSIPENGQRFIDLWALRHHPYLRFKRRSKVFYAEGARPVLLLDRLIDTVMREQRPLHWATFWRHHQLQPLKPVASSLNGMRAQTLDSFTTMDEFLECLRASARVPGIAGNPVEIDGELYADGLLFEPIPYRSALRDGCSDMLVLRTKPDSSPLKGTRPGIYEKHIATPYFDMFPSFAPRARVSEYVQSGLHLSVYNDDLLRLRRENAKEGQAGTAAIFSVTPAADAPPVGQLESRARVVYEGVRSGFAAAYDALSPFADVGMGADGGRERMQSRSRQGIGKPEEEKRKSKDMNRKAGGPRMTAGRRAAAWVFSDEEYWGVERRHQAAREARKDFRKAKRNRENREIKENRENKKKKENRGIGRALRRRRAERARRLGEEVGDLAAIEEQFFVG